MNVPRSFVSNQPWTARKLLWPLSCRRSCFCFVGRGSPPRPNVARRHAHAVQHAHWTAESSALRIPFVQRTFRLARSIRVSENIWEKAILRPSSPFLPHAPLSTLPCLSPRHAKVPRLWPFAGGLPAARRLNRELPLPFPDSFWPA